MSLVALASAQAKIAARVTDLSPGRQAETFVVLDYFKRERVRKKRHVKTEAFEPENVAMAVAHLKEFVGFAWPLVEPEEELKWNWHLDVLCEELESITRGETKRSLINIPPGTMKSLLVSVFWPAWEWASNPGLRYLTGSFSDALTIRDNLRLREIVGSGWYKECFWGPAAVKKWNASHPDHQLDEIKLRGDQNEKIRFDTTAGGWRIATGIGGRGVGEHPDRIIVDDPLNPEAAESEKERERAWRWMKRTLSSRGVARNAARILIMQRLHEEDPSGRIIDQGDWHHICIPMRYEAKQGQEPGDLRAPSRPEDPRTEEGQLLWPELFPEAAVKQLELDLDEYGAAGQLQQRPAPAGGGLFKREWFEIVDVAPATGLRVRFWDMAATDGGGDWTVGTKMLMTDDRQFFIEDVIREQVGPMDSDGLMLQAASMDGRPCRIREEQEGGASGKKIIAIHARTFAGYDYKGEPPQGDKRVRARAFRAQCEARNVKLVRGPWNEKWLRELSVFPEGKNDDQVDSSSGGFNELTAGLLPVGRRKVAWG